MEYSLLSTLLLSANNEQVQNQKPEYSNVQIIDLPIVAPLYKDTTPKQEPPAVVNNYSVVKGDTLYSIAKAHNLEWERLWDKNTNLTDPDIIEVGDNIVIPNKDEVLQTRPIPANAIPTNPVLSAPRTQTGSTAGNTYGYGYCTWYVKNMRPDLPNNLGNADTWYIRAQAQGYAVGSVPQVGAVGVATGYMHVVYVTAVNGNQVTVSEMNYNGWNVVSTRVTSSSEFLYIY